MRATDNRLKCYTCGDVLEKQADGKYVCLSCGNVYDNPQVKKEETNLSSNLITKLNNANEERQRRHFDRALELYDEILQENDKEVFALWGAFLSEYGIEFVKEGGQYRPICHSISRIPATQSEYLTKLYKLCGEVEAADYRRRAEEIELIRYRSYEISETQDPYDIFICYGGNETDIANQLFENFTADKRRVFMPQKSIPAGAMEEGYIYPAINSAGVMFVIAESYASLAKTENIWLRFLSLEGKRIQVLHKGLIEAQFSSKLRKTFQKQASIDYTGRDWLKTALAFAEVKKKEAGESTEAVRSEQQPVIDEDYIKRLVGQGRTASNLSEAMAMVLSSLTVGDPDGANRIVYEQFDRLQGGELAPIAELCIELTRLQKSPPSEKRYHMDNVRNIGDKIRVKYPTLSLLERNVYSDIKNATLLVYLAKCFAVIKDSSRQCFVLDMIDIGSLYDTRTINDLIRILLTNGRSDEVSEVLSAVRRLDGNFVLTAYLNDFKDEDRKAAVLLSVADKMDCTDDIADDINRYLSDCENLYVALAVVSIMNRCHIRLDVMGLSGALAEIKEGSDMKLVLENFGSGALSGIEIDKLVAIAAEGGDGATNELLRHLRYKSGITDIGVHNMQLIINKCNLENIKMGFFDFNVDKKLAENLLVGTICGNGADRLSTVNILIKHVSTIDISSYAQVLTGSDPLKKEFMKLLAPKTNKFAGANNTIELFLKGRDSDEDKREIFATFGDFPFSERVKELYLDIIPERYDETYLKYLYDYLKDNPAKAREYFIRHYETLAEGYESVLPKIFGFVRHFGEDNIVNFVCEFKGKQEVKDKLLCSMGLFFEKPKKIEVSLGRVNCNLFQAYLLTVKEGSNTIESVARLFKKAGVAADDKVICLGKKMKFKDYLNSGEVDNHTLSLISDYVKL